MKSSPIKSQVRGQTAQSTIQYSTVPELVAHEAVDDKVSCRDEAEEDVGHVAQEVVPGREPLALPTHSPTRPGHTRSASASAN